MAGDLHRPGTDALDGEADKPGLLNAAGIKLRDSLGDTLLSEVWMRFLIAPTLTALSYGGLVAVDIAPPPGKIVQAIRGGQTGADTPQRSVGITQVKAQGDGTSGSLARELQVPVTQRLRGMPEGFGGIRIQYALGAVTSGRGASSATSLRWALAARGTEWVYCDEVPLTFTSRQALGTQIASQINNSLLASETTGELQCG